MIFIQIPGELNENHCLDKAVHFSNVLAAVDIVLVLLTLVWALVAIWPRIRWVAVVNIPYLVWVCFATVLQLTITWLNQG